MSQLTEEDVAIHQDVHQYAEMLNHLQQLQTARKELEKHPVFVESKRLVKQMSQLRKNCQEVGDRIKQYLCREQKQDGIMYKDLLIKPKDAQSRPRRATLEKLRQVFQQHGLRDSALQTALEQSLLYKPKAGCPLDVQRVTATK